MLGKKNATVKINDAPFPCIVAYDAKETHMEDWVDVAFVNLPHVLHYRRHVTLIESAIMHFRVCSFRGLILKYQPQSIPTHFYYFNQV